MQRTRFRQAAYTEPVQPWQQNVPIGRGIFDWYPNTLGDVTISGGMYVPSTRDGPICVIRGGNVVLSSQMTTTNRCRGLVFLCNSLTVSNGGVLHMSGKGARGSYDWLCSNNDISVPSSILMSSERRSLFDFRNYISQTGYYIGDPVLWARPPADFGVTGTISPGAPILVASGCGAGAAPQTDYAEGTTGNTGGAGSRAPGGGGSGGVAGSSAGANTDGGAPGCPWAGGSGSCGVIESPQSLCRYGAEPYGGCGGISTTGYGYGAGNDQNGNGVGGVLIIIALTSISIASGGIVAADGGAGSSAGNTTPGGGGSGGGFAAIISPNNTIYGTLRANGGIGGAGSGRPSMGGFSAYGGAGGAGGTFNTTLAALGW